MKRSELTEFGVEEEGFKLKICRALSGPAVVTKSPAGPLPVIHEAPASASAAPHTNGSTPATAAAPAEEPGVIYVKSPMVGTFYRAGSPEAKPFVDGGAKVVETSVVCIIEAMKIMNEIQAELKGTIVEALVENGQPVEYGQRLFKVKSS